MNKMFSKKIYDQFAFEQLGCVVSSMAMGMIRKLNNNPEPVGEGILAASVGTRVFKPDWQPLVEWMKSQGFIDITQTGRGASRIISLTEKSKALLDDRGIEPEPEPVAEPQPTE